MKDYTVVICYSCQFKVGFFLDFFWSDFPCAVKCVWESSHTNGWKMSLHTPTRDQTVLYPNLHTQTHAASRRAHVLHGNVRSLLPPVFTVFFSLTSCTHRHTHTESHRSHSAVVLTLGSSTLILHAPKSAINKIISARSGSLKTPKKKPVAGFSLSKSQTLVWSSGHGTLAVSC